jgi:hypothetical protein
VDGDPVDQTESTFAFSCPVPGRNENPRGWTEPKEFAQVIGAAVFNMDGLVIGTIDTTDPRSDGTKFALKSSFFLNELETILNSMDKTVRFCCSENCCSRGKKDSSFTYRVISYFQIYLSRAVGGFRQGTGTSRGRDATSGSASRKR